LSILLSLAVVAAGAVTILAVAVVQAVIAHQYKASLPAEGLLPNQNCS
jgi:hypothetical protein